jgi:hypothetical protein
VVGCTHMECVKLYVQGVVQTDPGPATVVVLMEDSDGTVLEKMTESIGNAFGEYAEYHAVMRALLLAVEKFGTSTRERQFDVRLRNEMVKRQLRGEETVTHPGLVPLFMQIHNLQVEHFPNLTFTYVRKKFHVEAEQLVKGVLDGFGE